MERGGEREGRNRDSSFLFCLFFFLFRIYILKKSCIIYLSFLRLLPPPHHPHIHTRHHHHVLPQLETMLKVSFIN